MPAGVRQCPACGAAQRQAGEVSTGQGELIELSAGREQSVQKKATPVSKQRFFAELRGHAKANGKSEAWCLATFRERYNEWPHGKNSIQPIPPSQQTLSYIRSRQIRWAKSKRRAA